jgi:flagellar hook-associated protein 3 FlgL
MRITSTMMMESALRNIETNQQRTEDLQAQITSGSRITKPSDDPVGAAQALDLQHSLDANKQYGTNLDQATSWLDLTDSSLNAVDQALQRANELAVQAANGTMGPTDMAAIQSEIQSLQQHVLDVSHTQYGSYYIFSGTKSDQPGYVQPASSQTTPAAYQGNNQSVQVAVSKGVTMAVNADAQATFDPAFDALGTLLSGLQTNNQAAIQSGLSKIGTAIDAVSLQRAEVGAKTNRVQLLQQQQSSATTRLSGQLSNVKDTDMAEAITNFSMAQSVYQASLKAAAQALQPSLLDYLH